MARKRLTEEERSQLLKEIHRLEMKILDESESEDNEEMEDVLIEDKENSPTPEEEFYEDPVEQDTREEDKDEEQMDTEVLDILGVAPVPAPKKKSLHKEIADRWSAILDKGIKKEEKETINHDNPPFENIPKMVAPKLNKEALAALNEGAKRRDVVIENRQKQISTALACVGQALQLCIGDIQSHKLEIIKKMNETGRLLCDSLYLDSKGRRNLVLSSINKELKESLLETESAEYLFGENLTDKIKTAKAVQKSGKDLKTQIDNQKKDFPKRNEHADKRGNYRPLNWRGPPRGGIHQRPQSSRGSPYNRPQNFKKGAEEQRISRRGRK